MPSVIKMFDSYRIWYNSGHPYEAHIYCYNENIYVGRIIFYSDGGVADNANLASGPSIHYGISRFEDITRILREESPLYIGLNTDNLIGYLATASNEPVGEEES